MLGLWFRTKINGDSNRPPGDNENSFGAFFQKAPSSTFEVAQTA